MGTGLVLWMSTRLEKRDKADAEYRLALATNLKLERKLINDKLASIEQRVLNLPCPRCEHALVNGGDI